MALFLMLGVMSCNRPAGGVGLDDSTFVATMADLRRIHGDSALSAAQRDSARAKVLQTRGLTPAELDSYARYLAGDPERAVQVWQALERKMINLNSQN